MIFADLRLKDFRVFIFLVWATLGLPQPTKVQYDMANCLQGVVKHHLLKEDVPWFKEQYPVLWDEENGAPAKRVVLQAFRGVGKSWITSAVVDWVLAMRPDLNNMVCSSAKQRADEFSTFTKRLIHEVDVLAPLKPDFDKGHRYSNVAFDVGLAPASHAPSVKSVGVMGQLAGSRADLIVPDDVETPNTSETQTMREKLAERVKEFDAILKPGGVVLYLGTPQCEDTVYAELEKRGYKRIVWPARYPSSAWMKAHSYALAGILRQEMEADPSLRTGGGLDGKSGKPCDPERFSEADLCEREASYGRSGFALQFMLDTSLADADRYPLKLSDLIVMALNPDLTSEHPVWAASPDLIVSDVPVVGFRGDRYYRPMQLKGEMLEYQGSIMAVDPSGRGKDELAYVVLKQLYGFIYLMECRGLVGGFTEENLSYLANRAKHWKVNKCIVEPNYGGGMFNELLKPIMHSIYPCKVEDAEWSTGQKERRIIQTLEPLMNQHRLVVNKQVILEDQRSHSGEGQDVALYRQLFHQLTRLTADRSCLKHDDRLDALAIGVAYFTKAMAQDAERKSSDREWKDTFKRQRERMKTTLGPKPTETTTSPKGWLRR